MNRRDRRRGRRATGLRLFLATCAPLAAGSLGCESTPTPTPAPADSQTIIPDDSNGPRRYEIARAFAPIRVDGILDDEAWEDAPWSESYVDIEGDAKPLPRYRTRMKMLWDDEYLYVAADMVEPHVWASLTAHDSIVYHDNDFEIFIDPDGDTELYYEVEVNAYGTIFDLFLVRRYIDGGPALHEWDFKGMQHAIAIDGTLNDPSDVDEGWTVEFALPWEPLRTGGRSVPPKIGDVWRMNFSRVQWRHEIVDGQYVKLDEPEMNWVWTPQGAINMHLPSMWGYTTFVDQVAPLATPEAELELDVTLPEPVTEADLEAEEDAVRSLQELYDRLIEEADAAGSPVAGPTGDTTESPTTPDAPTEAGTDDAPAGAPNAGADDEPTTEPVADPAADPADPAGSGAPPPTPPTP